MVLIPERRRRLRVNDPGGEREAPPTEVDLHRVHLARPSRPQVPAVVVALLGFLAGAIVMQSFWGGLLGLVVVLLIRAVLERTV
jgi:hypothetical protein